MQDRVAQLCIPQRALAPTQVLAASQYPKADLVSDFLQSSRDDNSSSLWNAANLSVVWVWRHTLHRKGGQHWKGQSNLLPLNCGGHCSIDRLHSRHLSKGVPLWRKKITVVNITQNYVNLKDNLCSSETEKMKRPMPSRPVQYRVQAYFPFHENMCRSDALLSISDWPENCNKSSPKSKNTILGKFIQKLY